MYLFNRSLPSFFETLDKVTREFENFASDYSLDTTVSGPKINLYRGKEGLILTAKVAGVEAKDLDISIVGQTVTISGEYKSEEKEEVKFYKKEIKTGNFTRTLELPFKVEVDKVKAEFDTGILKMYMPQADSDKPKKIDVKLVK